MKKNSNKRNRINSRAGERQMSQLSEIKQNKNEKENIEYAIIDFSPAVPLQIECKLKPIKLETSN